MPSSKRFISDLLHARRDQRADETADGHTGEDESERRPPRRDVLAAEDALREQDSGETAAHEHFAVSEVEQSEHAIHEGVAHRDHRIEGSVLQTNLKIRPERDPDLVEAAQPEVLKSHAGPLSPNELLNVIGAGALTPAPMTSFKKGSTYQFSVLTKVMVPFSTSETCTEPVSSFKLPLDPNAMGPVTPTKLTVCRPPTKPLRIEVRLPFRFVFCSALMMALMPS